eukprot:360341-Chlamydomonas_euryale.AAC.13
MAAVQPCVHALHRKPPCHTPHPTPVHTLHTGCAVATLHTRHPCTHSMPVAPLPQSTPNSRVHTSHPPTALSIPPPPHHAQAQKCTATATRHQRWRTLPSSTRSAAWSPGTSRSTRGRVVGRANAACARRECGDSGSCGGTGMRSCKCSMCGTISPSWKECAPAREARRCAQLVAAREASRCA